MLDFAGKLIAILLQRQHHLGRVAVRLLRGRHPDSGKVSSEQERSGEKYNKNCDETFHTQYDNPAIEETATPIQK
jgi:hypothetical protein